jgi:hypothetical protein
MLSLATVISCQTHSNSGGFVVLSVQEENTRSSTVFRLEGACH